MKYAVLFFVIVPNLLWAQNWKIVDIVSQSKKELVYFLDNGEKVERIKTKNPSIVHLISSFEQKGYRLEKVTQGIELILEGNLPVTRQSQQWGLSNLIVDNNNRIMLWFRKTERDENLDYKN